MGDVVKMDVQENIYEEEVTKCLTPGMVTEEKAYFETCQKINQPAKEMQPLGQNQQIDVNPFKSNWFNSHNSKNSGEEGELDEARYEEIEENHSVINANHPNLLTGGSSGESSSRTEISEIEEGASHVLIQLRRIVNDLKNKLMEEKSDELRLKSRKRPETKKALTLREMKLNAIMKKLSVSGPSSSVGSTRTISSRVSRSYSRSESCPSLPSSSASCRLSSVSACSVLPPTATSRGALIMDKMADKEIVQWVFKAFRRSVDLFKTSSDEKVTIFNQVDGGGEHEQNGEDSPSRSPEGTVISARPLKKK